MNQSIVPEPIKFEWDKGNKDKNFKKHGATNEEAEEVFFNDPLIFEDLKHSIVEKRYDCLGKSKNGKKLFISFTIRKDKVRLISFRSMSKKERINYEKNE